MTSSAGGKVPTYRGIRNRGGKWVSEIREPKTVNRIWLGTFATPGMAAAAYDVAALTLKGSETPINFPEDIMLYPVSASRSSGDIQKAAAEAAAFRQAKEKKDKEELGFDMVENGNDYDEYVDMDSVFDMPNMLNHMADAMMVNLPSMASTGDDQYDQNMYSDHQSDGSCNLWSYD